MTPLEERLRVELASVAVDLPGLDATHARVVRAASRRRNIQRMVGAAVAALCAAVVFIVLPVADGRTRHVDVIAPPPMPTVAPIAPEPEDARVVGESPQAGRSPVAATRPGAPGDTRSSSGPPAPGAVAPTTAAPAGDPGCVAEGYDHSGVNLKPDGSPGGVSAGTGPQCTYTATQAGGYVAQGKWRIEIRRGSYSITASSAAADPSCRPVGFIEPGDVVTVTVLGGVETQSDPGFVKAGPQHSCSDAP